MTARILSDVATPGVAKLRTVVPVKVGIFTWLDISFYIVSWGTAWNASSQGLTVTVVFSMQDIFCCNALQYTAAQGMRLGRRAYLLHMKRNVQRMKNVVHQASCVYETLHDICKWVPLHFTICWYKFQGESLCVSQSSRHSLKARGLLDWCLWWSMSYSVSSSQQIRKWHVHWETKTAGRPIILLHVSQNALWHQRRLDSKLNTWWLFIKYSRMARCNAMMRFWIIWKDTMKGCEKVAGSQTLIRRSIQIQVHLKDQICSNYFVMPQFL